MRTCLCCPFRHSLDGLPSCLVSLLLIQTDGPAHTHWADIRGNKWFSPNELAIGLTTNGHSTQAAFLDFQTLRALSRHNKSWLLLLLLLCWLTTLHRPLELSRRCSQRTALDRSAVTGSLR